jgi:hypothetical protein
MARVVAGAEVTSARGQGATGAPPGATRARGGARRGGRRGAAGAAPRRAGRAAGRRGRGRGCERHRGEGKRWGFGGRFATSKDRKAAWRQPRGRRPPGQWGRRRAARPPMARAPAVGDGGRGAGTLARLGGRARRGRRRSIVGAARRGSPRGGARGRHASRNKGFLALAHIWHSGGPRTIRGPAAGSVAWQCFVCATQRR